MDVQIKLLVEFVQGLNILIHAFLTLADIAQYNEWNFRSSVEWELTDFPYHKGVQNVVRYLNKLYNFKRWIL